MVTHAAIPCAVRSKFTGNSTSLVTNTAGELKKVSDGHLVRRGVWIRPMGVDTECFSPAKWLPEVRAELLQHFSHAEQATLLLYVGRLVSEKNLGLLVETMSELRKTGRDFRLLLVGDGIARPQSLAAPTSVW